MLRIAMISASRIPSRAANSIEVMKVGQSFLQTGHAVRLWAPTQASVASTEELKHWYGVRDLVPLTWVDTRPALRKYDFAWKAVQQARSWRADLIYCWPLQAAAISCLRGIDTALEIHDRPGGMIGPSLLGYVLRSRSTRLILPITQAMKQWLERRYRLPLTAPRSVLAPMGVDLELYKDQPDPEDARDRLGLPQFFTVGYMGHLYEGRGLELIAGLARENLGLRFIWVGGEPEAVDAWRRRLEAEGVRNVDLLGFVPNADLPQYQAACEVLLMPYERKIAGSSGGDTAMFASPMKAFEYLASGRAILASDLPVLHEILDERVAVLLPVNELEAWDRALKSIAGDAALRQRLGRAAREKAASFSWTARARRILDGFDHA